MIGDSGEVGKEIYKRKRDTYISNVYIFENNRGSD